MTQKKKEKSKTDEEILFPEVKIGKYTIKPWSFGVLFDISSKLENVLDRMKEKEVWDLFDSSGFVSYVSMARLFTIASSEVLSIIATTLKIEEDEVKEIVMEDGIQIAYTIYKQNSTVIKNALAPLLIMTKEEMEEEGEIVEEETENQEELKEEKATE